MLPGRDAVTELEQFSGDPLVAPARVLACEPKNKLLEELLDRPASSPARRLCPFAADEFAMPAQKRLRRHEQSTPAIMRQQPRQRGEKGAVGGSQPRPGRLAAKHREFVTQREQFDFAGERVAPAGREQPQQGGEGEVDEGEQHPSILAERACQPLLRGKLLACK